MASGAGQGDQRQRGRNEPNEQIEDYLERQLFFDTRRFRAIPTGPPNAEYFDDSRRRLTDTGRGWLDGDISRPR